MRLIKVSVSLGLVGCRKESTIEVEDDCDRDEIEQMAREEMFTMIEWGWSPFDEKETAS